MQRSTYDCLPVDVRISHLSVPIVSIYNLCLEDYVDYGDHVFNSSMISSKVQEFLSNALGMSFVTNCSWWSRISSWWCKGRNGSQISILIGLLPSIITWALCHRRCLLRMEDETFDVIVVICMIRDYIFYISQQIHSVSHLSSIDRSIL